MIYLACIFQVNEPTATINTSLLGTLRLFFAFAYMMQAYTVTFRPGLISLLVEKTVFQ